jgi:hypothetical protein
MKTFNEFYIEKVARQSGLDISKYDPRQIQMGMKVELEHGSKNPKLDVTHNDPTKTLKIVLAHLAEDPCYYTKLKKVEEH